LHVTPLPGHTGIVVVEPIVVEPIVEPGIVAIVDELPPMIELYVKLVSVGDIVGMSVGDALEAMVGISVGEALGARVGELVTTVGVHMQLQAPVNSISGGVLS
jgi:hypothetical protein